MQWEYFTLKVGSSFWLSKIDERALVDQLNALGAEGWELACSLETNLPEGRTNEIMLLFKRPKS